MSILVTDLSSLDPTLVEQVHAELAQLMQEKHPEVELTRGVVHDLVLYFAAVFNAKAQTEADRLMRSSSVLEITKDPELADDDIVDRAMSNYLITRAAGARAVGSITVVVSKDISVPITDGLLFSANGQLFASDEAYIGKSTGSILQSSTDRQLLQLADGNFAFTIEATAVDEGSAGNLKKNTQMVPEALPNNFVKAYAATDFIDGFPTETNTELLTRLQEGVAAKTWCGRTNISALIKENFERVLNVSTIGFGDAEMDRDQHWIWPSSGGGRTDSYVRSRELPQEIAVRKTATLIEINDQGSVWQFPITRDDAPGFYEVVSIRLPSAATTDAGYEVTADMRAADLSGDGFIPDVTTAQEASYTRYQTAVIRFLDTDTVTTDMVAGTTTQDYDVGLSVMPLIADIQEMAVDRGTAPEAADALVKAAVPCFLNISFDLRLEADAEQPDLDQIANDLSAYVNNTGFCGQLHASKLADIIHNSLVNKAAVGAIDMFGRIRRPDGVTTYIRDDAVLIIPDLPEQYVTGRTTVFILDPRDVAITPVTAGFPNI